MDQSRKRSYDHGDDPSAKRAAVYTDAGPTARPVDNRPRKENEILFKLLCPPTAVGSIIGKGGTVLTQLKEMTGCKIRVSQSTEFYPGTGDRVIGIWGPTKEHIMGAIGEIAQKIYESLDKKPSEGTTHDTNGPKDHFDLRCLIPSAASGSIIGRGGSVIKEIGERTNSHLNLEREPVPTNDPYSTKERILVIRSSTVVNVISAAQSAFAQIQTDPVNATYVNQRTSYDVPPPAMQPSAYIAQPQSSYSSYGPQSVTAAPQYPPAATYSSYAMPTHAATTQAQPAYSYTAAPVSAPAQLPPRPVQQQTQAPPPAGSLPPGCTLPIFETDGTKIMMKMGIPEELLGSIIGKQGSIIKEISNISGASCQVTQKGDYLPGTTLRSLKVSGSQQQVQLALNNVIGRLFASSRKT